jgi:hypothetical protein
MHEPAPHLDRVMITLDHPGPERITGSLRMPFATGRNPATAPTEAATLAWLAEHGLLVRGSPAEAVVRAGRFHELAGLVHRAEDPEALQIVADYVAGLFFFDDLVDTNQSRLSVDPDLAARAADLVSTAMRSGQPPAATATAGWPLVLPEQEKLRAIGAALADVGRRLVRRDPAALEPFLHEFEVYVGSMAREAAHRSGRAYASLAEYEAIRSRYSAVHTCIELGLALRGVVVPAATRAGAAFHEAREAANLSVSYVNDLFSYKRELLHDEQSNLVMVLERVRGLSRAEAFAEACRITDGVMERFLAARAELDGEGPEARAAAVMFESWIRGNYDWHERHTQRYVRALSTHTAHPAREGARPEAG